MTRRKVRRTLDRIRDRLKKLFAAERGRDLITRRRRRTYRRLRDRLGAGHPKTVRALRSYRASLRLSRKIDHTEAVLRQRAEQKLDWLEKHPRPPTMTGITVVDGRPVATAVAREVVRIRAAGRWKGVVASGYRTPAHSTALCIGMCGAPQCPGRCAGAASRHAMLGRAGAVDVTEYDVFAQECARLDSWLENHLPNDPVHFSDIGN